MGWRFWRRVKVAPGVTLNLSKSGVSVSVGPRGAKVTVGPSGTRATVGIPGTGLHYSRVLRRDTTRPHEPTPRARVGRPLLAEAPSEDHSRTFAAALLDLELGEVDDAVSRLRTVSHHADAALLAGLLLLQQDRSHAEAEALLRIAVERADALGALLGTSAARLSLELAITEDRVVHLEPDLMGATLAWVEALQRLARMDEARRVLRDLDRRFPGEPLVALSLDDLG